MPLLRKRRTEELRPDAFTTGWEVPGHFNFTRDVIDALADDPTRGALTFVDAEGIVDRRSFAEISGDAARWAHLLRTRLDRGDRVLVLLGKSPAWHCAMLGAIKGGLVAVPCPDMLRARDIAYRVRHSGARLVIAERSCEIEVEEMRNQVEGSVAVLYLDEAKSELARYMPVAPTEDTTAGETALILYTSGTTKDPKGVVHTHAYTWAKRMQASHWLGAHEQDVVWCTASTGWAKAVWNVLLGPWSFGAEIVLHEAPFEPEQRLSLLAKLGVTVLCQAPTEYRLLAKLDSLEKTYLPRLRHVVSAGEPLNPEVIERFRNALGLTIYDGYGQTENTLLVANTPDMPIRPGSMGLPTPGHDIAVIDEQGHVCAPGEEGDLALIGRPPTLFTGYWEAPEDTNAAFRDSWYVTGDRAVRDEEGYLWFVGRADDVILSAAYRIGPFEVESALLEHPAVAESAVVGVPDQDRGQIVKAFVVLRPGHEASDALAAELQSHVKSVTAPYKYPRAISFVDELPKTSSGKIRRVELRENPDIGSESVPGEQQVVATSPTSIEEDAAAEAAARRAEERRLEAEAARQRLAAELAAHREANATATEATQLTAAEAARRDAEERMRYEAEEAARRDAEAERALAEAEQARLREAQEARARAAAEETARLEAEERARAEADETARREAEEARARAEAEETRRTALEAESPGPRRSRGSRAPRGRRGPGPRSCRGERAPRSRGARPRGSRGPGPRRSRGSRAPRGRRGPGPRRKRKSGNASKPKSAPARKPEEAVRREEEERIRAEAEAEARALAEAARARTEEAERERLEAEARARETAAEDQARAEEDEAARRQAEEADHADRRLAAWRAAQVAASERVQDDLARIDELAPELDELDDADEADDGEEDDGKLGWREARRRKKEEEARQKQAAKDAERRAKEEAEQRKRDEAAAKQRAKEEAEQRKRDEAAAKERAKFEAEQRKVDEANAREEAKRREEEAKRREAEAKEAAKRRAEEEKEEAKRRAEEERRLKKLQSKTKRRGQLYDLPDEEVDPVDGTPAETIPGIVDRLQRYSNMPDRPTTPPAPEHEDVGAETEQ